MTTLPENTTLVLIDVQQAFLNPEMGERNNPDAEANIGRLLQKWRDTNRPIIHVQHNSTEPNSLLRPEKPGNALQEVALPQGNEPLITKNVNSAFIGTDLESRLRENGYDTLVIVGLTTQHCVSTTTRMAGNLGFTAYLVADATAAYATTNFDGKQYDAEVVHAISLATLNGEFATVLNTDEVLDLA